MENLSHEKKLQYLRDLANGDAVANKLIDAIKSRGKKELCHATEQFILRYLPSEHGIIYHIKKMVGHLDQIVSSDEFRQPLGDCNFANRVKQVQETLDDLTRNLGCSLHQSSGTTQTRLEHGELPQKTRHYRSPNLKPYQILTEDRRHDVRFNIQHFLPKEIQKDIWDRTPSSFLKWRSRYAELQKNENPPGITKHGINIIKEGEENFYWILKSTPREIAAELFEGGLVRFIEIEAGERLRDFPSIIYQSLDKERFINPHKDLMLSIHSTPPEWDRDKVQPSYHLIQVTDQVRMPNQPGCMEVSLEEVSEEFASKSKAKALANIYTKLQCSGWTTVAGTSRIVVQKKLKRKERKLERRLREEFEKGILEGTHGMSDLARDVLTMEMKMHRPKKGIFCSETRAEVEECLAEHDDERRNDKLDNNALPVLVTN